MAAPCDKRSPIWKYFVACKKDDAKLCARFVKKLYLFIYLKTLQCTHYVQSTDIGQFSYIDKDLH